MTMNGEWGEQAPPICLLMNFPCAARAGSPSYTVSRRWARAQLLSYRFGMSNIEYSISSVEVRKLCTWTLGVQHSILDISETGLNRESDWLNCEWVGGLHLFSCS